MIYVCVYLLIFHIYNISSCIHYIANISKLELKERSLIIKIILTRENLRDYRQDTLLHSHVCLYLINKLVISNIIKSNKYFNFHDGINRDRR